MCEIDRKLKFAIYEDVAVELTYYERGKYVSIQGKLQPFEQLQQYIIIANENGQRIPLDNIVDVTLVA